MENVPKTITGARTLRNTLIDSGCIDDRLRPRGSSVSGLRRPLNSINVPSSSLSSLQMMNENTSPVDLRTINHDVLEYLQG